MGMAEVLKAKGAMKKSISDNEGLICKAIKLAHKTRKVRKGKPAFLRSSQLYDFCPRELVFYGLLYESEVTVAIPSAFSEVTMMQVGTDAHTYLQDEVLGPMGVLKGDWKCRDCKRIIKDGFYPWICPQCACEKFDYREYKLFDKTYRISGHIDGLVCLNRLKAYIEERYEEIVKGKIPEDLVHLEIKTCSSRAYSGVAKSKELAIYYKWQGCQYQQMLLDEKKITEGRTLFLYMCRENMALTSFFYHLDKAILQKIRTKAMKVWDGIKNKKLPPIEACASVNCKKAKECEFRDRCFLSEKGKELD